MMASSGSSKSVFISFRGQDTRKHFCGFLCKALRDRGFSTSFEDAETREKEGVIHKSRNYIIVISEDYASSTRCLDRLDDILVSVEKNPRLVLPVFYDVDSKRFKRALDSATHAVKNNKEKLDRLKKWRKAASSLGWHFKLGDGYENGLIEDIVDVVYNQMNPAPALRIPEHPVGLENRVLRVNGLLDKFNMIGICGEGGIGKTTLAHAVYNFIAPTFHASCFLHQVREYSTSSRGLERLQETLLADTSAGSYNYPLQLANVSEGIPLIKHKLSRKKVLVILDDVDSPDQLLAIVGRGLDLFGPGSKVIVTARDKHLLKRCGIRKIYEMEKLTKAEAQELLYWKAFQPKEVQPDFIKYLKRAVTYASGVPLALEVIGSSLYGKRTVDEWEPVLDSFAKIRNKDIQTILRQCYDSLDEDSKKTFLDIAYFCRGCELPEVERMLKAYPGHCLKQQIGVFIQKSLITIDEHNCVKMHDLIQDIAREIVQRGEAPLKPLRMLNV